MSTTEAADPGAGASGDDLRIAAAIRRHRLRRNLTLAQLSERSGISTAHLSRLETGGRTPTVRLLLQLARALGVSVGTLVGESSPESPVYVSRSGDRPLITAAGDTALRSLSDPGMRCLQVVELHLPPGRLGEPAVHSGEEWVSVIAGAITLELGGATWRLGVGDAAHFRADAAHSLHNPHDVAATVLVVNGLEIPAVRLG